MRKSIARDKGEIFPKNPRQMHKKIHKSDDANGKHIMKQGIKYPSHKSIGGS